MKILVEFDHKKATQVMNFFAEKAGGSIDKLKLLKLVWLADRYHLRKYGRPIVNDTYMAMRLGPVASAVKDLAEASDFRDEAEIKYSNKYFNCANNKITSINNTDINVFSDSDLEALNIVANNYLNKHGSNLVDLAHKYPEWKKHEESLKITTREPMSYTDFFKNPETKIQDIFNDTTENLAAAEETFNQNYKIAKFWTE